MRRQIIYQKPQRRIVWTRRRQSFCAVCCVDQLINLRIDTFRKMPPLDTLVVFVFDASSFQMLIQPSFGSGGQTRKVFIEVFAGF